MMYDPLGAVAACFLAVCGVLLIALGVVGQWWLKRPAASYGPAYLCGFLFSALALAQAWISGLLTA